MTSSKHIYTHIQTSYDIQQTIQYEIWLTSHHCNNPHSHMPPSLLGCGTANLQFKKLISFLAMLTCYPLSYWLSTNATFSYTSRLSGGGGGAGFLISNSSVASKQIHLFRVPSCYGDRSGKMICGCLYHPPGKTLDTVRHTVAFHSKTWLSAILIQGDMNIHLSKRCTFI